MDSDLSMQLLEARTASTQYAATIAVMRKTHEMEMTLIQAIDETARAAPPAGQGKTVDRLA